MTLKRSIKNVFIKTNSLSILDKINYVYSVFKYSGSNKKFKKLNPGFAFPPDYYLYETYKLDYKQYKQDGALTAYEFLAWTKKYIKNPLKIMEWGCGVARIIRHIPNLVDPKATVFGTDINKEMIAWSSTNILNVIFSIIDYYPPTHFDNNQFDLIFAVSVFTHIEAEFQVKWMAEIHRIIAYNGIFLFTTHGKKFEANLNENEKRKLERNGALTIDYKQKGHRMMTTYNNHKNFKGLVEKYFEILEYYEGQIHPNKVGGQDLWIARKNKA